MKSFTPPDRRGHSTRRETALSEVVQRLDKVAAKGTIHKNTAARKRSRLAKRLNAARRRRRQAGRAARSGARKGKARRDDVRLASRRTSTGISTDPAAAAAGAFLCNASWRAPARVQSF